MTVVLACALDIEVGVTAFVGELSGSGLVVTFSVFFFDFEV